MAYEEFGALERECWSDRATAGSYAECFSTAAAQCVPALVDAVQAKPGMRALDLCCGHGIVARGLADAGAEVTGLDFSPAMLALARERVPGARMVEGDAMDLPFDAGSFDAVTIGFGIPHVPVPERALAEARRVLLRGGRLAYTVWQGQGALSIMTTLFDAIDLHGDPAVQLPQGPDAHARADPAVALPEMKKAGFTDLRCETIASAWTIDDPGAPFDFFRDGTARGGSLLRRQPEANAAAIREGVVCAVRETCGPGPPWVVPLPAVMISGVAR